MYPIGTPDAEKKSGVRRYPYIIVPLDPPTTPIPADAIYLETLVFALEPYPVEKVLSDYCKIKKLDVEKFRCHSVVFAKDMRQQGTGTLNIQRDGDGFRMGVNWRP